MSVAASDHSVSSFKSLDSYHETPALHGPTTAPSHHTYASGPPSQQPAEQRDAPFPPRHSSLFNRNAHLNDDARRDSGMAHSTSTVTDTSDMPGRGSTTDTSTSEITTYRNSNVPSIVVNDESRARSPNFLRRPRTRQRNSDPNSDEHGNAVQAAQTMPFQGIGTNIPSGEFEDPFSSQDLAFSKRGTVLMNGSAFGPAQTQSAHSRSRSSINRIPVGSAITSGAVASGEARPMTALAEGRPPSPEPQGRPSSASNAESHRHSTRLRSWYSNEAEEMEQDPRQSSSLNTLPTPVSEERDLVPDLPSTLSPRPPDDRLRESRSASRLSDKRMSRVYETAGGLEDWTDLESKDVDRYGFYNARALNSKRSSVVSSPAIPRTPPNAQAHSVPSPQAVLTERSPRSQALSRESSQRNNRLSVNPDGKNSHASPSINTARSNRSATSRIARPFSRSSRIFEQSANMLTSTPGLDQCSTPAPYDPPSYEDAISDRTLERKRAAKWARMAQPVPTKVSQRGGGTDFHFDTTNPKLISRTWKGIPDCWRGAAWYSFLSTSARRNPSAPTDEDLEAFFDRSQGMDCADDVQIDMDVPRTVGGHVQFRQRYRGGQRFLFRVLRALSLWFPETGYVQGMASVVATLLNYYTEERAFVMAVRLWSLRGIGWLYSEGFGGLMSALDELEKEWMGGSSDGRPKSSKATTAKAQPDAKPANSTNPSKLNKTSPGKSPTARLRAVAAQLESLGIHSSAWGPKWYLTLFNYVLPFPAQLRVWDVFILLGSSPLERTVRNVADQWSSSKTSTKKATPPPTAPGPQIFGTPNLDPLHAVAAAILLALSETLIGAEFENAMGVLTGSVNVGVGREDLLMGVAGGLWRGRQKRR